MKSIVPFVVFVLLLNIYSIPAHAASSTDPITDLYADNISESVDIDGINYTYVYSYDLEGNRVIYVTNTETGISDIVTYDISTSTIYFNDEEVAKTSNSALSSSTARARDAGWEKVGSGSQYISWATGTSAAALAAVIAIALGVGSASIIAVMGVSVLGVIAGAAIGGTVKYTCYAWQPATYPYLFQYDYTFTASTGDTYGPYSIIYS